MLRRWKLRRQIRQLEAQHRKLCALITDWHPGDATVETLVELRATDRKLADLYAALRRAA